MGLRLRLVADDALFVILRFLLHFKLFFRNYLSIEAAHTAATTTVVVISVVIAPTSTLISLMLTSFHVFHGAALAFFEDGVYQPPLPHHNLIIDTIHFNLFFFNFLFIHFFLFFGFVFSGFGCGLALI